MFCTLEEGKIFFVAKKVYILYITKPAKISHDVLSNKIAEVYIVHSFVWIYFLQKKNTQYFKSD